LVASRPPASPEAAWGTRPAAASPVPQRLAELQRAWLEGAGKEEKRSLLAQIQLFPQMHTCKNTTFVSGRSAKSNGSSTCCRCSWQLRPEILGKERFFYDLEKFVTKRWQNQALPVLYSPDWQGLDENSKPQASPVTRRGCGSVVPPHRHYWGIPVPQENECLADKAIAVPLTHTRTDTRLKTQASFRITTNKVSFREMKLNSKTHFIQDNDSD